MNTQEILLVTAVFSGLLALRFGVPLLIMWLFRRLFGRLLPAQVS
jgi:NhaP-type Na+/H+ and K+/H+ antiporter